MRKYKEFLENAKRHRETDMLITGNYGWMNGTFRGCSVGCHLHDLYPDYSADDIEAMDDKHSLVAYYYGYPEWLCHLQDTIFEGLPEPDRYDWHVQLAETLVALPEKYDWQNALHRIYIAILKIVLKTAGSSKGIVQRVINLHERVLNGEDVYKEEWLAAAMAALAASAAAAESAAESASAAEWAAAAEAAGAARWTARWAASAAESAAAAEIAGAAGAAFSAARSAEWAEIREGVLKALEE